MKILEKDNDYFRAKDKVDTIKKFYTSVLLYLFFIGLLGGINYWTDEWGHPWFLWAALGWGVALVFRAIRIFGLNLFFGRDWEERKIREYMQRGEEQQKKWK